jgi:hypothetical protein
VLIQLDSPVAFTAATLFGDLWIVVFVALYLSFVTGGRLTSTVDLVIVGTFSVDVFVLQVAMLLFLPQEDNLLLVRSDAGIASALEKVRWAVLIVGSIAVVLVIGERWRSASPPRRRAAERCCPAWAGACAPCCSPPGSRASL